MAKLSGRSCRIYDDVRDSKIHWDADINQKCDADLVRQHKERAFPRAAVGEPDSHERQHTRSIKSEYADKEKYVLSDFKPEMKLPTFDSSSLTLDFLDWIDALKDYFEAMNLPDTLKCKLTASKLKGEARVWWKELQNQRFLAGKDSITSWPIMRELLIKEFLHTSCLTYFYKQKNEDNMEHTNCLIKVPSEPHTSQQNEASGLEILGASEALFIAGGTETSKELASSENTIGETIGLVAQKAVSNGPANASAEDWPCVMTLDAPSYMSVTQHAKSGTLKDGKYQVFCKPMLLDLTAENPMKFIQEKKEEKNTEDSNNDDEYSEEKNEFDKVFQDIGVLYKTAEYGPGNVAVGTLYQCRHSDFEFMDSETLILNFYPGGKWQQEQDESVGNGQLGVVIIIVQRQWDMLDKEMERLALKLILKHTHWSWAAITMSRFVTIGVDAYLTPFLKRYLYEFLPKFDGNHVSHYLPIAFIGNFGNYLYCSFDLLLVCVILRIEIFDEFISVGNAQATQTNCKWSSGIRIKDEVIVKDRLYISEPLDILAMVKILSICETMDYATTNCYTETGTSVLSQMTIVEAYVDEKKGSACVISKSLMVHIFPSKSEKKRAYVREGLIDSHVDQRWEKAAAVRIVKALKRIDTGSHWSYDICLSSLVNNVAILSTTEGIKAIIKGAISTLKEKDCCIEDANSEGPVIGSIVYFHEASSHHMHLLRVMSTFKMGGTSDLDKMKEIDALCGDGRHDAVHMILIGKPCEEVMFLCSSEPWDYSFSITRGRVIPWEGWNDEYYSNKYRKFIMTMLSVSTISLWLNILWHIGHFKKILKLFFKTVNGLDPPFDVDGKLMGSLKLDSYDLARGRAFCVGDGLM